MFVTTVMQLSSYSYLLFITLCFICFELFVLLIYGVPSFDQENDYLNFSNLSLDLKDVEKIDIIFQEIFHRLPVLNVFIGVLILFSTMFVEGKRNASCCYRFIPFTVLWICLGIACVSMFFSNTIVFAMIPIAVIRFTIFCLLLLTFSLYINRFYIARVLCTMKLLAGLWVSGVMVATLCNAEMTKMIFIPILLLILFISFGAFLCFLLNEMAYFTESETGIKCSFIINCLLSLPMGLMEMALLVLLVFSTKTNSIPLLYFIVSIISLAMLLLLEVALLVVSICYLLDCKKKCIKRLHESEVHLLQDMD